MQTVIEKVIDIIRENFPNGIRNDYIDTGKILRLYSSNHADEIISREFVTSVIHVNGLELSGRFYFPPDNDTENLTRHFGEILERHGIIYYSVFYKKYSDIFSSKNIFSPEVLKKILQENDSRHYYFEDFCSANKMIRLEYEVARLFSVTNKSLSIEDLQKKLLFVPPEKILLILSDTKKYLTTPAGKYVSVAKIQFDKEELCAAKKKIFFHIGKKGYAEPADYDLTSNFALNPEVAKKDLLNIIHEKFFSDSFTKRGRRFFGRKINQPIPIQDSDENKLMRILTRRNEIDLDTLLLSGNEVTVLSNALKIMVRVSEKIFVKATRIKFDIDEIDAALTPFVQEKIIPLKAVTSFSGFPPVEGYSWNLFMLESFLRRYSRKYRFMTQCAGNANIGAIYPRSMKFKDYFDVQLAAILNANVPLEKNAVKNFLSEQGYRQNHFDDVCERIISRAATLPAEAAT
ncbi:MAG: hypothetical protein IKI08_07690 [Selenomonadaceae bacterium]|nr:hypothetical protein [Selenomonadaceae bacterium]MBR7025839.1 hypothetical protein [Selenomonadaceae bacterium]MBR7025867.1 hypothetical protein [Selenomonadaceae bacterium]